ncbi:50S ribosomal protein L25 [Patescibacteria group bacterium]|nr:50S ribosomal protein L25 [Patescibacteria group bacterium]MCL5010209.1 50S ribosomal protein L25 [Patescibacteria group bacterium]
MQRLKLKVEERKLVGKKVKQLRREKILPANIYGKDIKSAAVKLPYEEFEKVFKETGETGLIDLELNGEIKPVLIHNVQLAPITHTPLHADFYQVNLKEKIKSMVPIEIIGEAKAVTDKIGLLMQTLSEIEIEALPADLPEKIGVNVENLAAVDEQITVGDLKIPGGATVLTDFSQIVVKITELISKEAEEQAAQEAQAAEEAKTEATGEEVKEGEAKPETKSEQKEGKQESPTETTNQQPGN